MSAYKPPKPPPGCKSVIEWERELSSIAMDLFTRSRELLKQGDLPRQDDRIRTATAKELALAAIRATKLAAECASHRENDERTDWLVRQMHDMKGTGGNLPPRTPLRFGKVS